MSPRDQRHPRYTITPAADKLDLMLAFAGAPPEAADAWIDNKLIGLTLDRIAELEGVSKAAVGLRVQRANRAIRDYLEQREATCRG